jgi:dienelactone hydrolase
MNMHPTFRARRVAVFLAIWFADPCAGQRPAPLIDEAYLTFYRISRSPIMRLPKTKAWKQEVPEVREVAIRSSHDSTSQPALFYDSGSDSAKPLLIALHSWSADYRQHFSIPYGLWCVANDWVFMHPDYRGAFVNAEATASEAAVADVLDATAWAMQRALVDTSRVYITGFSGGGMMALVMTGRFPRLWTAAVAWVPVYDLADWYGATKGSVHDYSHHIVNACGGAPVAGTAAYQECRRRSPSAYMHRAREAGVDIYIATGIKDNFVPPSHSMRAFNALADPKMRIADSVMAYIDSAGALPQSVAAYDGVDSLYREAGLRVLLKKRSAAATLILHDSKHDVIYNAGLVWLSRQGR